MDAKACKKKGGTWNSRKRECTRDIEMAVGNPDGTWYTTMIGIPINTSEKRIENVAVKRLTNELDKQKQTASFINIHWIPPLEED